MWRVTYQKERYFKIRNQPKNKKNGKQFKLLFSFPINRELHSLLVWDLIEMVCFHLVG